MLMMIRTAMMIMTTMMIMLATARLSSTCTKYDKDCDDIDDDDCDDDKAKSLSNRRKK